MKVETIQQAICHLNYHMEHEPCDFYEDITISSTEVKLANGVLKDGIEIRFGKYGIIMYPQLPIDSETLIQHFHKCVSENQDEAIKYGEVVQRVYNFNQVSKLLKARLYNKKCGFEVTYDVPNSTFNDLCIVPYIELPKECAARVTSQLLEMWKKQGVTDEMILYHCLHNVEDDVKIFTLAEDAERKMLVITNHKKCFGAISILFCEDELHERLGDDIIIIPSSVHEVIAVSANDLTKNTMDKFIQQVNGDLVEKHEILSNHYYTI